MKDVPDWPSNTQAVERSIRRVKETAKHVMGEERRDERVLSAAVSCKMLPYGRTKANYSNIFRSKLDM